MAKVTNAMIEEMCALRRMGMTKAAIGRELGISRATVARYLTDAPSNHHGKDKREQAIALYEHGATVTDISEVMDIPYRTVSKWTKECEPRPYERRPATAVGSYLYFLLYNSRGVFRRFIAAPYDMTVFRHKGAFIMIPSGSRDFETLKNDDNVEWVGSYDEFSDPAMLLEDLEAELAGA